MIVPGLSVFRGRPRTLEQRTRLLLFLRLETFCESIVIFKRLKEGEVDRRQFYAVKKLLYLAKYNNYIEL